MASVSISCPSCSATDGVVRSHTPPAEAEKAYYASIGNDDLAA
ncbi:hypothetical protein FG978_07425 [Escherichia coli]|nr:hypothetical protein [Escherichia coli]